MPLPEHVEILLHKASQDEFTIAKLSSDPDSPDEVIGFHAQQATEKILKAVLSFHGVRYRYTHDLVELIDQIRDAGIEFPSGLEDIRRLGPFATVFRYDELAPELDEPFDRSWAMDCVRKTIAWAQTVIGQ